MDDNITKKPLDHKKSIHNRIENLRRTQTANNQASLEEKETQMRSRLNLRVSVYDKAKSINNQLNHCETNRKEKNFSSLTEQFGLHEINLNENSTSTTIKSDQVKKDFSRKVTFDKNKTEKIQEENSENEEEDPDEDPEEFQTRKRIMTKKSLIQSSQPSNLFKSNESIRDFLSQAKSICDDYEKEIELLRKKISVGKTFNNNLLQIVQENENKFEFFGNCTNYFITKMSEISKEASPDFNMLNQVYSEKIQELFMENDSLNNVIRDHKSQTDKVEELGKINEEVKFKLKDKEVYIENMNEIYASKFTEIFTENEKLKKENEEFSTKIKSLTTELEKVTTNFNKEKSEDSEKLKILTEEKNSFKFSLEEKIVELEKIQKNFEEEKEKNKKKIEEFESKEISNETERNFLRKELDEEKNLKKNFEENLISANEKVEKLNKEYDEVLKEKNLMKENFDKIIMEKDLKILSYGKSNDSDKKLQEMLIDLNKEKLKNENLEENLNKKKDLISKLQEEIKEINKVNNNIDDIDANKENNNNSIDNNQIYLNQIKTKDDKIKSLEEDIESLNEELEDLNKDFEKKNKKLKDSNEELDNLRDIITKDQIRIRQLKEFKEKALEINKDLYSIANKISDDDIHIGRKSAKTVINISNNNNNNNDSINANKILLEEKEKEINLLTDKLNDERKKNKLLCEEFRKLQENLLILKEDIIKKDKKIETNINIIEELKVRLKNKIKQDELLIKTKSNDNINISDNNNNNNNENLLDKKIFKSLIVENLLLNYQLSQSISLNFIVDNINKNFNFLLNSIFGNSDSAHTQHKTEEILSEVRKINTNSNEKKQKEKFDEKKNQQNNLNLKEKLAAHLKLGNSKISQISILHEFLENFILNIFDEGIKNKNSENKNFSFSKNDFSFDLICQITTEISENNFLTNFLKSENNKKINISDLFSSFGNKFEKIFIENFSNSLKIEDYLNNEIRPLLIENLKNFNLSKKNQVRLLIDKILLHFQEGYLMDVNNKSQIYDFKLFNKEYSQFNFMLRNSSNITNETYVDNNEISAIFGLNNSPIYNTLIVNLSNIENILNNRYALDYFNFLIKAHGADINKLIIKGDLKKKIELNLLNIFFTNLLLFNKTLKKLSLNDIDISSESSKEENEALRRNSIYRENINFSLMELTNFINFSQNLSYLNISNCKMGDDGLMHLCKNIHNFNIIELNLSKNDLKDLSGFYLAELLPKLNNLQYLNLSENSLNGGGFTSICNAISTFGNSEKKYSLKQLDFSSNNLMEADTRCIVELLIKYEFLEEFDLSFNNVDAQMANSLGIYLRNSKNLKRFLLKGCNLNEESCPLFIKNLEGSAIRKLILDENPIGQIGGILFANLLKGNKNLGNLSLKKCGIPGNVVKMILKNYEGNENLLEIDLSGNLISDEEKKFIYETLGNNNNNTDKKSLKVLIN